MSQKRSRRRRSTWRSNVRAALLAAISVGIVLVAMIVMMVRHDRSLAEKDAWMHRIPWDPSWPALAIAEGLSRIPVETLRALYAFAGTHPEVVDYIPCFCGCRGQGHGSSADCYVKHRSAEGYVTEWETHALVCPLAPDIIGDVILWREKGRSLLSIRQDIDREYAQRGPATPTAEPPPSDR